MSNTNHSNAGSPEWQALATRGNQSPMRSRASMVLESELRRLLDSYTAGDICGLWIDWTIPSKEPLWIPAGDGTGEAA